MLDRAYLGSIASAAGAGGSVPAPAQANCFVESGADTVLVSSMAELESAVNSAPPGRNVLIAPGTYNGGTHNFDNDGTDAAPIVVRPRDGLGTVTINNASWTLADTSSRLVFEKLHFDAGSIIHFHGDHNRISRCRFRGISNKAIRVDGGGRDCRLDHCDFSEVDAGGMALELRPGGLSSGLTRRMLIDHCYFHDFAGLVNLTFQQLGATDIARGESWIFDHCLFANITHTGEFVVIKHGGNIWRFCTFDNCNGYFQFRGGGHQEVRSCWFEQIVNMHAWQEDCLVIGNRFVGGINCWVPIGNGSYEDGLSGAVPSNRYEPSTNSQFIGNRFGSGHLEIGQYWTNNFDPLPTLEVENALLEANTRDSGGPAHEFITNRLNPPDINTTINPTTNEPFTPAVKLAAADVGLNAPDPLCPSGPQN